MLSRYTIILLLCFIARLSYAQEGRDSIVQIKGIEITARQYFKKEQAGMKETRIDTFVMTQKLNLSLSDLLSENTPVFIKSHGRGALATASFRGTSASHTQVNWNGININSPMAGMVDFSLIPVYVIDDMNLKHGTASIADKSGGLGGSVNINNSANWSKPLEFKYMQGTGSYHTYDEFLQLGGGSKKFHAKTRLYHNYSKNDYPFINRGIGNIDPLTGKITNPSDTNQHADYTRYGILQELYYQYNNQNIFSTKYWGQWAQRTIPRATSYEGPNNSNLNKQQDDDHKIVTDWKHYGANGSVTMRSGYALKHLTYSLKNFVPGFGQLPAIYSQSTQQSFLNNLACRHNFSSTLSVECSLDANYHDVSTHDTVQKTGYVKNLTEFSLLAAIHKNIAQRLNLNIMLRQGRNNQTWLPVVPFLGFDYQLIKSHQLILKGNIARNYHAPSLNDLYWQPGGNPHLLPEKGVSYEMGLAWSQEINQIHITSEITAYRSDIDNWIIWLPSYKGYWEPQNIKNVLSQGIEFNFQISGHLHKINYRISGSYAYTSSVNHGNAKVWGDNSNGKQLVYVPLHSGNLLFNASWKGFSFTFQHNNYSERYTTSSNDITRRDWLYPYYMNDVVVGKAFHIKKISLSTKLKIYNLFNETYHSILYRPMPGRNYMLTVMVKI